VGYTFYGPLGILTAIGQCVQQQNIRDAYTVVYVTGQSVCPIVGGTAANTIYTCMTSYKTDE